MNKLQLDPNRDAFNQSLIRRLNAFSEIDAVFTTANAATAFTHGLGKVPQHAIVRASDKPVSIYQTAADVALWTASSITLRANNSSVTTVIKIE